ATGSTTARSARPSPLKSADTVEVEPVPDGSAAAPANPAVPPSRTPTVEVVAFAITRSWAASPLTLPAAAKLAPLPPVDITRPAGAPHTGHRQRGGDREIDPAVAIEVAGGDRRGQPGDRDAAERGEPAAAVAAEQLDRGGRRDREVQHAVAIEVGGRDRRRAP